MVDRLWCDGSLLHSPRAGRREVGAEVLDQSPLRAQVTHEISRLQWRPIEGSPDRGDGGCAPVEPRMWIRSCENQGGSRESAKRNSSRVTCREEGEVVSMAQDPNVGREIL